MKELSLHITDVCNFGCKFCVWGDTLVRAADPIPRRELDRFLEGNRDSGFDRVNLHGGEPTLRRDLFDLLDRIRELGYPTVSLQSNGWALANRRFTERLVAGGVSLFVISVHGHTPEIHDTLSVAQGSLGRIRRGMELVRALGQEIRTNTVAVRANFAHLPEIAEWVIDAGSSHVNISSLMPTGRAWSADEDLMPTYRELEPYATAAIRLAEERGALASLEGFPRCSVAGFEEHCLFRKVVRGGQVRCYVRGEVWENHDTYVAENVKSKRHECEDCVHHELCGGPYTLYVENRGWSEFQPVAAASAG